MTLASNYASVMKDLDVKKVVSYMKQRGHLSVLPQVLNILEREKDDQEVVTVAKEKDAKPFKGARVVVDPNVVGGYMHRNGSKIVDATYRKALVTIYKQSLNATL